MKIPGPSKTHHRTSAYKINHYVKLFEQFARSRSDLKFLVTEIGCGLAGYTIDDIAPLFYNFISVENVYLPKSFWEYFEHRSH